MKTLTSIGHQSVERNSIQALFCSLSNYYYKMLWQLHKTYDEKLMDFLGFRRNVVCHYLEIHGHPPEPGRRGRTSQKRNVDSRYDGMNHVLVKQGTQTRCAECHKNNT
jgi:DNA excision repair protein ERCC-6